MAPADQRTGLRTAEALLGGIRGCQEGLSAGNARVPLSRLGAVGPALSAPLHDQQLRVTQGTQQSSAWTPMPSSQGAHTRAARALPLEFALERPIEDGRKEGVEFNRNLCLERPCSIHLRAHRLHFVNKPALRSLVR